MALISNAQVRVFSNEKARPFANHIKSMHRTIDQFWLDIVDYEALVSGAANGDIIDDGAGDDGRPPATKADFAALKYVVEQLKACMETDDRKALVNKLANLGLPLF